MTNRVIQTIAFGLRPDRRRPGCISLLCFMLLAAVAPSHSQDVYSDTTGRDLAILGMYDGELVWLRWATSSTVVWNLIRSSGVRLERESAADSVPTEMNNGLPLRPLSLLEWEAMSARKRSAAQVAALLRGDPADYADLSLYAGAQLEENRMTSLLVLSEFDFDIAEGLALGFRDATAEPGRLYRYRIRLTDPVHDDTLAASIIVDTSQKSVLPPVVGLTAEPGDRFVDLDWVDAPTYSGYFVERRLEGSDEFEPVSDLPFVYDETVVQRRRYRDSLANYVKVSYRVQGIDAFARKSPFSEVVSTYARDMTPPLPPYGVTHEIAGSDVAVSWTNPPPEPDLAGYALLRSPRAGDGYRPVHDTLLVAGTTSHTDRPGASGTFFYRLVAADTAGNISTMSARTMVVLNDTIPPSAPQDVGAVADTSGVIRVSFDHVREDDVAGYRVYRRLLGPEGLEYTLLTGRAIVDTTFTDTLLATVRNRFTYAVRAVDFAGNYSEWSDPASVRFPDLYPPVAPIIEDYAIKDERVSLRFMSASPDVESYRIYRYSEQAAGGESGLDRGVNVAVARPDLTVEVDTTVWVDSTANHREVYRYEVTAVDSAGNESASSRAVFAKPYWRLEIPTPEAPTLTLEATTGDVLVQWEFPDSRPGWSAIVFRRKSGESTFNQRSPRLAVSQFLDRPPESGLYEYSLRFYVQGRGQSVQGEPRSIEVPEMDR